MVTISDGVGRFTVGGENSVLTVGETCMVPKDARVLHSDSKIQILPAVFIDVFRGVLWGFPRMPRLFLKSCLRFGGKCGKMNDGCKHPKSESRLSYLGACPRYDIVRLQSATGYSV